MKPAGDTTLMVLCGGLLIFSFITILVAAFMAGNQAIYTLFAGIVGSFQGGLMMYLHLNQPGPPPGGAA
jgi:uncharacterized membrane-anchored protein